MVELVRMIMLRKSDSSKDFLNERIIVLEKQCGTWKYDCEELEVENESLEKDKLALEDKIGEIFTKNRELVKENEVLND